MVERTYDPRAVRGAAVIAGVLIAQHVAAKAVRDAYFLSVYEPEALPYAMGASAILAIVVAVVFTRLVARRSPATVVSGLFAVSAGLFAVEWLISLGRPQIAAAFVYVHVTALAATTISGFWSSIGERFDPHSARRGIVVVAVGATAGGVVGGSIAIGVGQVWSLSTMLLGLVVANTACSVTLGRQSVGQTSQPEAGEVSVLRGIGSVIRRSYLRNIAIVIALASIVDVFVEYGLKAAASGTFQNANQLVTFFAVFHTSVAALTLLVQAGAGRNVLERWGILGTVASLPVVVVVGSIVSLIVPGLWPLVAVRGGMLATENSLFRTGYELLYVPLTRRVRRATKTVIDVGSNRLGAVFGSGAVAVCVGLASGHTVRILLLAASGLSVVATIAAWRLRCAYGQVLDRRLRSVEDRVGGVDRVFRERPSGFDYCPTQRMVNTLAEGLGDNRMDVRRRCGSALFHILGVATHLEVEPALVEDAVVRDALGKDADREAVEYVLKLLCLIRDRSVMLLAYRAIRCTDPCLRGIGLEYIAAVLSARLRRAVLPALVGGAYGAGRKEPGHREGSQLAQYDAP